MPSSCSVFLNVRDLEKTQAFYKGLGFKVTGKWPDDAGVVRYVDMDLNGAEISIGDIAANDDPEFQKWVAGDLGTGVLININVPNVDRLYAKAQAIGATIEQPIVDRPYGRIFILNDPSGYSLTFAQAPRATRKKAAKKGAKKSAKKTAKKSVKTAAKKVAKKAKAAKPAKKAKKAKARR